MPRTPSSPIIVIILVLSTFAAIVVNAKWGSGFGFSLLAAPDEAANDRERIEAASQPRLTTTPLNAITSFDAAAIVRHLAGIQTLPTVNHLCAADVTNNGALTPTDASNIARYVISLTGSGVTGTIFPAPCHANYQTTIPVLKGDVTGQVPVITGGASGIVPVSLPAVSATPGTVIFPITIGNTTGLDIASYDFQITFDPAVITPAAAPVETPGTLSSTMILTANASNSGHLIVSAFRATSELSGSGTLLNLRFNIVGSPGQSTALTFEDYTDPGGRAHQGFMFNEGTPSAATTNGTVTVPSVSPTPTFTATGTPTPTTPLNAITSFDAAVIMRHVAGTNPLLTNNHKCAADLDHNNAISMSDVTYVGTYVAGYYSGTYIGATVPPPCSAQWPTDVPVLISDVSGTAPVVTGGAPGTVAVSIPAIISPLGSILVPISVGDTTGMDISSYDLQISYDSTIVKPELQLWTADQAGTLSSGMKFAVKVTGNSDPGHFIIAASQAGPLSGSGTLLNLRFSLTGTPGSSTALNFANYADQDVGRIHQAFLFNEGTPSAQTGNGSIFISSSSPTPTNTPTVTPTATPTNTPISTLGNYPDKVTGLSGNTTVVPDAPPTGAVSMSVTTGTSFMGRLEGDPVTGVVRITDSNPGGTHLIKVRAFDMNGNSATKAFTLTVATAPPCTPVAFAPPAFIPGLAGKEASTVAVGDFNGDSKQDLIVINEVGGGSVLLGNGTGGFGAPINLGAGGSSIAVGDFNGDGKQDVVVTNYVAAIILLGDGTGHFGAPTSFYAGESPAFAAIGDFDNDGRQDLAVTNPYYNVVSVLLGNGAGGFGQPSSFGFGSRPGPLAVGDFDHDGNQDLAIGNLNSAGPNTSLWGLLGNGRGGFTTAAYYAGSLEPQAVAVGDFNGDANQDVAMAGGINSIRFGNSTGGFSGGASLGNNPSNSIATGDFNGDTKLDVVVTSGGVVLMYLGNGLDGFNPAITFNVGIFLRSVAVGDFDGDGKQDIAVTDGGGQDGTPGVWILMRDCSGLQTSIRGTVTYGNATNLRPVSNVRIDAAGSPGVAALSDFPLGAYTLSGFGPGSYLVAPDLTGQVNGAITSFDAAKIAQHATSTVLLNANQLAVADVTGNGTVTSFDAGQIARYVATLPPFGSTGTWRFNPVNRSYASVASNLTGEDYKALLMGEVSGNWTNSSGRPVGSGQLAMGSRPESGIKVQLPQSATAVGKEILVPVNVQGVAGKGVISYEFDLRYDPTVIQPLVEPVDAAGTDSRGLSVVSNANEPGLLRIVVYGAYPIDNDGVLLNLRFTAVGKSGSVSPLAFERILFNEGEPRVTTRDGEVRLF